MFLNTPVGIVCLLVIGVTSLINIYAHWIEDGLVGRLLYMAAAMTAGAGLIKFGNTSVPEHFQSTIIALFALSMLRNLCVRSVRYVKYRRTTHAKKHQ